MRAFVLLALLISIIAIATTAVATSSVNDDSLLIYTKSGPVQGKYDATSHTRNWFGIPFAASPIGNKRFAPPQAFSWGSNTWDATHFRDACLQPPRAYYNESHSEDCLYLNIWAPGNVNVSSSSLPVVIWIYGGSFIFGSGSFYLYDGDTILSQRQQDEPFIYVTLNYRLGLFGWMVDDALNKEYPEYPSTGNYGLLDQRAAIQWIVQNIAAFGGDPNRVTIFGESAGAISTCFHVFSPLSANLFQRVMMESGPCLQGASGPGQAWSKSKMEAVSQTFLAHFNCTSSDPAANIACLRNQDAQAIIAFANARPDLTFGPIIDGVFMPQDPLSLAATQTYNKVEVLLGSNTDEGTMFVNLTQTTDDYYHLLNVSFPQHHQIIAQMYPVSAFSSPGYAAAAIYGDYFFTCSGLRMIKLMAQQSPSLNFYIYHWAHIPSWISQSPVWSEYVPWKVFHSAEMWSVFSNPPPGFSFDQDELLLTQQVSDFWMSFAVAGQPVSKVSPVSWPSVTASQQATPYIVLNTSQLQILANYKERECSFWESITPIV